MSSMNRGTGDQPLTVANGSTTSSAADIGSGAIYGLVVPAEFDGTAITFTVSNKFTGTYQALYDSTNTQVSMTVAASRSYDLPTALAAWPFLKIVCGTSQTGATVFTLVSKS